MAQDAPPLAPLPPPPPGYLARMPAWREATELVEIGPDQFGRPAHLIVGAAQAWLALREAAHAVGLDVQLVSAFRTIARQEQLVRRQLATGQTLETILTSSAYPGHSEHHTGRAIDLASPEVTPLDVRFAETRAFAWLCDHAARYGFRLSYPRDNPHGIVFEPWHWCWHPTSPATPR